MTITKWDILLALAIGTTAEYVSRFIPPEVLKTVIVTYLAIATAAMFLCGRKWGRRGGARAVKTVILCVVAPMCMLDYLRVRFLWSLVWAGAIGLIPTAGLVLGTRLAKREIVERGRTNTG